MAPPVVTLATLEDTHMDITITWTNRNPNTIYNRLAAKLGREPSPAEVRAELDRILGRTS